MRTIIWMCYLIIYYCNLKEEYEMTNYKKANAENTPRVELHEKLNLTGAKN